MNRIVLIALFVLVAFASVANAQEKVGFYPYNAFESKPLPVGTRVWANLGDGKCAYGGKFPSAAGACFERNRNGWKEYYPGRIKQIVSVCTNPAYRYGGKCDRQNAYVIEFWFMFHGKGGDVVSQWNGSLDDAFTAYNLPEKWAK